MKNETTTCEHCSSTIDLRSAYCDRGIEPLHCPEHCDRCARCGERYCIHALKENEVGEKLCEECFKSAVMKAAKRAAATGSHRDLHDYLKLRKAAS